ncbi:hypothetical protein RB653_007051 [Dictyostelium firmibasis]|uniref:Transmembrane protein n=1 Tax=Dictyostelium firmibasis TaxID=79012 RepID=A0AAN7YQW3_9MYCE
MAFDENQSLQSQQPQQQFMQPPIVPQVGPITKYKIQPEYECTNVGSFSTCYPPQLSNSLSNEEYLFIVERLNKLLKDRKKKYIFFTFIYIFAQLCLGTLLFFGAIENLTALFYIYFGVNSITIFSYIIYIYYRELYFTQSLSCMVLETNSQYANRNIRLDAYKKATRRAFIVKAKIYYPPTLIFTQSPLQMFNYQQQPLQYHAPSPVYQSQQQQQQSYQDYTLNEKTSDTTPLL